MAKPPTDPGLIKLDTADESEEGPTLLDLVGASVAYTARVVVLLEVAMETLEGLHQICDQLARDGALDAEIRRAYVQARRRVEGLVVEADDVGSLQSAVEEAAQKVMAARTNPTPDDSEEF